MASRALEPAIHAPGYQINHCLPPAGLSRPKDLDVYRFQRVVPLYTPDPAVAPDSAQLLCPPSCGQEKRNDLMPPAGRPNIPGDSFQFYDTRQAAPKPKSACSCPFFANGPPCTSLGPITDPLQCPCINRQPQPTAAPFCRPEAQATFASAPSQCQSQARGSRPVVTQSPMPIDLNSCVGIGAGANNKYEYYVNNRPVDDLSLRKIPLCREGCSRDGAVAPTPGMMMTGGAGFRERGGRRSRGEPESHLADFTSPNNCVSYHCQNPYHPSGYVCRPVFDRKYLDDCPEQNGPHPDHYTFL